MTQIDPTQTPGGTGNAAGTTDTNNVPKDQAGADNAGKTNSAKVAPKLGDLYKNDQKTVGLDKFLEIKNENKQLKKDMQALADKIDAGMSQTQKSNEIDALAKEYNVKPDFLLKLTETLEKRFTPAKGKSDDGKSSTDDASDDKGKKTVNRDEIFAATFPQLLKEEAPEYEGIAKAEVIKQLSFLPENQDKTFLQLLEETYGHLLTGKRGMAKASPGGAKEPQALDMARARKDSAYFKEIMADPKLKAEYNAKMLSKF